MQSNSGEIHNDFQESVVSEGAATEIDIENQYKMNVKITDRISINIDRNHIRKTQEMI